MKIEFHQLNTIVDTVKTFSALETVSGCFGLVAGLFFITAL